MYLHHNQYNARTPSLRKGFSVIIEKFDKKGVQLGAAQILPSAIFTG